MGALKGGNMQELYAYPDIPGFLITVEWSFTPRF
jgi:hypothetical protein